MLITVTDQDIGERGNCGWNCPLARAVQRATGKPETDVFVGEGWVEVDYGSGAMMVTERLRLPLVARRWQRDYDRNGRVGGPISFKLDVEGTS